MLADVCRISRLEGVDSQSPPDFRPSHSLGDSNNAQGSSRSSKMRRGEVPTTVVFKKQTMRGGRGHGSVSLGGR